MKGRQFSVGVNEYTPAPCCFRILSQTLCAYIGMKVMPDVGMESWWEMVLILLKLVGKFITWQGSVGLLTKYCLSLLIDVGYQSVLHFVLQYVYHLS